MTDNIVTLRARIVRSVGLTQLVSIDIEDRSKDRHQIILLVGKNMAGGAERGEQIILERSPIGNGNFTYKGKRIEP